MPDRDRPAVDRAALDALLEMSGGDRAFLADLVDTFISDGHEILDALAEAADAGRSEDLVRPAHTLKGNATSFGATELAERSRVLEMDARSGSVEEPSARVAEIAEAFAGVEAALRVELRDEREAT